MKLFLFFAMIAILSSCNNTGELNMEEPRVKDSTEQELNLEKNNITGCYMRVLERDTFVAVLKQNKERVTGKLSFDNYQKDGSTGVVEGMIEDNIIKLTYSFQSEGTNSVMDIYFKKEGEGLVRGIGEIGIRGDTSYFINTDNVEYPPGDILRKIDCKEIPSKYQ